MQVSRKRTRKNQTSKGKRSRSAFDKWIAYLRMEYGFDWEKGRTSYGKDYRACLLSYGPSQIIPRRMPNAKGPLDGAALSVTQMAGTFGTSTGVSSLVISQGSATPVNGAIAFRLDDLDQVSTFSSLFDQYRIDRIHVRIRPRNTSVYKASTASPNQVVPFMIVIADFDDATALSTASDYRQYGNAIEAVGGDTIDVILEPSITPSLYASGAFSGYGVQGSSWIDIANTSVPHYGIKFYINSLQATATDVWAWDVMAWYQVSFKNVR